MGSYLLSVRAVEFTVRIAYLRRGRGSAFNLSKSLPPLSPQADIEFKPLASDAKAWPSSTDLLLIWLTAKRNATALVAGPRSKYLKFCKALGTSV